MALIGRAVLIVALITAVYGIGASIHGARTRDEDWVASGRRSVYAIWGLALIAFVILERAFLDNDFSYNVVAAHSSTTTPTFYKLAAPWSSQEGSLLLWVFLLSGWSSIVLFATRKRVREIAPYATAVLCGFAGFFTMLMVFYANPFATTSGSAVPAQGAGLDPLLLHSSMMIHPPMLYSGYTLMAIPFAFAIGALIAGRVGSEWIRVTRKFALAAWLFLGVGILLGARWSYTELGWGGYWAWDAVENAALMPWLCVTAFLHSAMIQEKRGMLKVWNVSLIMLSGLMAIFGTFLVRSGVLDSIHAFGASTLGVPFVILLGVMLFGGIYLISSRRDMLRADSQIDSLLSREAIFLFQNLVLVALVFVIFWVTMFPLISQAITGTKVSVGPPAFQPFVVPLALILVLLSGVGPLIAWRKATAANLRRNFTFPVAFAVVVLIWLLIGTNADTRPFALIMFLLGAFVIAGVFQELYRGTAARRAMTTELWPLALVSLVRRNRRRYGGYIAHLGLATLLIGVAASSSFLHSRDVTLAPGQSTKLDGYTMKYVRPIASATSAKITLGSELAVYRGGHLVTDLTTTRGIYPTGFNGTSGPISEAFDGQISGDADSDIGISSSVTRDLWAVVNPTYPAWFQNEINKGDQVFEAYMQKLTPAEARSPQVLAAISALRGKAIIGLAHQYVLHPWAVEFLLQVDPLVSWLWAGALIIAIGGLIALSPLPVFARRRSLAAAYSSRLARELA
jgi:cytochrome c-type biogenesis protein CcmF